MVPMQSWAYVKLRVWYPSPGAPRKVAALISAARIEARIAHQGRERLPRA